MLALTEHDQAFFSGIRSTFYRVAMICGQGGLVILAGTIQARTGSFALAWSMAFALGAGIFLCLGVYHRLVLPRPAFDQPRIAGPARNFFAEFFKTFGTFFQKPKIAVLLLFLLLYRLGEAQLVKMVQPFLLDPREQGGLGLTDDQVGLAYGTAGIIALMLGGLLGGFVVARHGLKFWLWPMLLAIHLPDAVFVWLAYAQPENIFAIGAGVAIEQFGYGFGFTAFMLYMIYIARGEHQTAHYAICTGFMALGMMLPGMWSGWLQEHIGYQHFFVWVLLATIPSFIVVLRIPLEAEFGKRNGK
jgi:PAT family beta-lactamase induction signal transducer AmpG